MFVHTGTIPIPSRGRRFYVVMAAAGMLVVFAGFAPTYYFRSFTQTRTLSPVIHAHAMANTLWLVLFFGQATLVAAGRTRVHRRLGVAGGILAVIIVLLGLMTAVLGARSGWNPGGGFPDSLAFMIVGLRDIVVFAAFVGAGLYQRRASELHKRLMLLGTIGGLMWPAITRMPYVAGRFPAMLAIMAALMIGPPVSDLLSRRRVHPVDVWGGLLVLASFPVTGAIGRTAAWHTLAAWLIA
jgi:hypothetical protein